MSILTTVDFLPTRIRNPLEDKVSHYSGSTPGADHDTHEKSEDRTDGGKPIYYCAADP